MRALNAELDTGGGAPAALNRSTVQHNGARARKGSARSPEQDEKPRLSRSDLVAAARAGVPWTANARTDPEEEGSR